MMVTFLSIYVPFQLVILTIKLILYGRPDEIKKKEDAPVMLEIIFVIFEAARSLFNISLLVMISRQILVY